MVLKIGTIRWPDEAKKELLRSKLAYRVGNLISQGFGQTTFISKRL